MPLFWKLPWYVTKSPRLKEVAKSMIGGASVLRSELDHLLRDYSGSSASTQGLRAESMSCFTCPGGNTPVARQRLKEGLSPEDGSRAPLQTPALWPLSSPLFLYIRMKNEALRNCLKCKF